MNGNKIIIAAAILGISIVASALILVHAKNVRAAREERRVACAEHHKAFDNRLMVGDPRPEDQPKIYQQCKSAWQPEIDRDCSEK